MSWRCYNGPSVFAGICRDLPSPSPTPPPITAPPTVPPTPPRIPQVPTPQYVNVTVTLARKGSFVYMSGLRGWGAEQVYAVSYSSKPWTYGSASWRFSGRQTVGRESCNVFGALAVIYPYSQETKISVICPGATVGRDAPTAAEWSAFFNSWSSRSKTFRLRECTPDIAWLCPNRE